MTHPDVETQGKLPLNSTINSALWLLHTKLERDRDQEWEWECQCIGTGTGTGQSCSVHKIQYSISGGPTTVHIPDGVLVLCEQPISTQSPLEKELMS